jgi:hypothetical protein
MFWVALQLRKLRRATKARLKSELIGVGGSPKERRISCLLTVNAHIGRGGGHHAAGSAPAFGGRYRGRSTASAMAKRILLDASYNICRRAIRRPPGRDVNWRRRIGMFWGAPGTTSVAAYRHEQFRGLVAGRRRDGRAVRPGPAPARRPHGSETIGRPARGAAEDRSDQRTATHRRRLPVTQSRQKRPERINHPDGFTGRQSVTTSNRHGNPPKPVTGTPPIHVSS